MRTTCTKVTLLSLSVQFANRYFKLIEAETFGDNIFDFPVFIIMVTNSVTGKRMKLQVRFDKDGWSSSGSLILIISRKTCFSGAAPAIYEYMFNTEGSSITTTMYVVPNPQSWLDFQLLPRSLFRVQISYFQHEIVYRDMYSQQVQKLVWNGTTKIIW